MKSVVIVIPCYNLGQFLAKSVQSAVEQTYDNLSVVLVDDGSTDELTKDVLSQLKHPRLKKIFKDNRGAPHTRNLGVRVSHGDYFIFLDADDFIERHYVQKAMALFSECDNDSVGIVTSWTKTFGGREDILKPPDFNRNVLAGINVLHTASMFRRTCWEKVGGQDVDMPGFQDYMFWVKIVAMGYEWRVIPEILFYYRVRPNSLTSTIADKRLELRKEIINRNTQYIAESLPLLGEGYLNYLNMKRSWSWKMTAPLRWAWDKFFD